MILFSKKTACLICSALTLLSLTGCGKKSPADPADEIITLPTAPIAEAVTETTSPAELVEDLTAVLEAGEIYTLDYYPNLKTVDLSGSTCYSTILDYMAKHPNVDVTYTVSFGAETISNKVSTASLNPDGLDGTLLLENLAYLPNLTTLSLPDLRLDAGLIDALAETYPDLNLEYTVELLGDRYDSTVTQLDLSHMTSAQVEEACSRLGLLTKLTDVQLSSSLSMEEVARLQDANPGATFHYSFTLFGKTLSTTDESVEFVKHSIGNEGEGQLRQALAILDNCQRFVLDQCGIDNEILAKLRDDFRDTTKVIWRVFFGVSSRYSYLTDVQTIIAVYNVTDSTVGPLKYCEDVKHIDMGHNDYLTDLSFVGSMPNLESLIVSGCAVKELVGFENCKKLIWLELANCLKLENIDALAGCESLAYLNLSNTKVTSYQMLDALPLKQFMCIRPKASKDERTMFEAIHEDCWTSWSGYEYGKGWRYEKDGKTYTPYYKDVIRVVFDADRREALVAQGLK